MAKVWIVNICRVVIVAAVVGGISSSILSSATMIGIGNQLAIAQLENSDFNALVLNLYNQVRHAVLTVDAVAVTLAFIAGVRDIYRFYTKENTNEKA